MRSLIEFRLKKAVPFDIGAARMSYRLQNSRGAPSVLVAAAAGESVRPLEQLFAKLGLRLGFVSLASASMLNLVSAEEMTLVTKLGGSTMTMTAVDESAVRLVRSVEAPAEFEAAESTLSEWVADMYPTFAYIEDRFGSPVARLCWPGSARRSNPRRCFVREFGCPVEALRSANGVVGAEDAGIEGYLHAA